MAPAVENPLFELQDVATALDVSLRRAAGLVRDGVLQPIFRTRAGRDIFAQLDVERVRRQLATNDLEHSNG